jgi:hypothetical protein
VNELIHWLCVPLVLAALLGLAWSAPVPETWQESVPWFNWVLLFIAGATVFYVRLSPALSAGLFLFMAVAYAGIAILDFATDWPVWRCAVAALAVAGLGLALGNRLEALRPTLRQHLVFPLLAPAWLVGRLYQQVGQRF